MVIGKAEYSIRCFLNSKSFKTLLGIESESGILVEPVAATLCNVEYSIRDFLNTKGFKALLGNDPASAIFIEPITLESRGL